MDSGAGAALERIVLQPDAGLIEKPYDSTDRVLASKQMSYLLGPNKDMCEVFVSYLTKDLGFEAKETDMLVRAIYKSGILDRPEIHVLNNTLEDDMYDLGELSLSLFDNAMTRAAHLSREAASFSNSGAHLLEYLIHQKRLEYIRENNTLQSRLGIVYSQLGASALSLSEEPHLKDKETLLKESISYLRQAIFHKTNYNLSVIRNNSGKLSNLKVDYSFLAEAQTKLYIETGNTKHIHSADSSISASQELDNKSIPCYRLSKIITNAIAAQA